MRAALLILSLLTLLPAAVADDGEVFHPEKATIDKFPRELPRRGSITFRVKLKRTFFGPVIVIIEPGGKTRYVRPDRSFGSNVHEFDVEFQEKVGAFRVELIVDSPRGDTTAAQFTIWVGVKRPAEAAVTGKTEGKPQTEYEAERPDESTIRLERKLFRMMNAYRKKLGLTPYPWIEQAAHLGREHWTAYLALKPRPEKLTHQIPGQGFIADRFEDVFAWPQTIRKFPLKDPNVGPEAICYCSESLAAPRSLAWLFNEYFLKESAFRAPVISEYPTHAAVGMVRDRESGRLYLATIYIQVNSTRVLADLEREWKESTKREAAATDPAMRSEFLRRIGRISHPESRSLYRRRLTSRHATVRAAALDALFLTDDRKAQEQADRWSTSMGRTREAGNHRQANLLALTLAAVEYDVASRLLGEKALASIRNLAGMVTESAREQIGRGNTADARATLEHLLKRLDGLPDSEEVAKLLETIGTGE